jgi:uncharacterized protein
MVRLEIGETELPRVMEPDIRQRILDVAQRAGFRFIAVDLEGFRSGRLNEHADGGGVLVPLGRARAKNR